MLHGHNALIIMFAGPLSDLDECRLFSANRLGCSDNADCINTAGSYECRCKPGFYGDGRNCFSKILDPCSRSFGV